MTSVGWLAHVGAWSREVGTLTFVTNRLGWDQEVKEFLCNVETRDRTLGQVTGSFYTTQETQGKSFGLWGRTTKI